MDEPVARKARSPYGQKPSRSADALLREEFARLAEMEPWDRMLLALELGDRCEHLTREVEAFAKTADSPDAGS